MKGSYFVPQVGQVYQNRNDRSYLCLSVEKKAPIKRYHRTDAANF